MLFTPALSTARWTAFEVRRRQITTINTVTTINAILAALSNLFAFLRNAIERNLIEGPLVIYNDV